jgi:DNA helicase HerA-like ATPase
MPETPEGEKPIGKTSATDRDPNTSDKFNFWLAPGVIVNPFDIVEVPQVGESKTYGLVTILEHRTDAPNHLSNYISSNFGEVAEEPNTPRQGTTLAKVNVLSNSKDIYMPVQSERQVWFASSEGIWEALGINDIPEKNRIPAGLVKMSTGTSAVAYLDSRYLLGPDGAHVNITGISGLATKTSYAMFLIQSILQTAEKQGEADKIAVIILNVKHGDLLQIDVDVSGDLSDSELAKWGELELKPKPFSNVRYFLPRGHDGTANSHILPVSLPSIYAYDLESTADKLGFMFDEVSDPSGALQSLVMDIMHGILGRESAFRNVDTWENLLNGEPLFKDGKTQKFGDHYSSTVGKFRRHLRRMVRTRHSGLFVDNRATSEVVLADEIRKIRGGDVFVVDIAKLYDHEQALVFGDLLKTIYELKSESEREDIPEKIIFFVDELNKYAPKGREGSPILEQVLDIAERGRSLGVILISAQQFMSAVHPRVTGNCATKVLGRSGSSEVFQTDYRFLDDDIKINMTRLSQGELILCPNTYRQPVKVVFPRPAFKQQEA